jgi:hypothetical protein
MKTIVISPDRTFIINIFYYFFSLFWLLLRDHFSFLFSSCAREEKKKSTLGTERASGQLLLFHFFLTFAFSPYDLVSARGCFKAPTGSVVFFLFRFFFYNSLRYLLFFVFFAFFFNSEYARLSSSTSFHDATLDRALEKPAQKFTIAFEKIV